MEQTPRWFVRWSALLLVAGTLGCPEQKLPPGIPDASSEVVSTTLPAPSPDATAAVRLAAALVLPCGPATTTAVVEALARAGIETQDESTGQPVMSVLPPALGLHVTWTQARGMGCELGNRGGLSGQALDDLAGPLPLPDGNALPVSALLAAYVTESGPFGSQLAAALMGQVDPKAHRSLVFPSLVVTTFMREVVVPMLSEAASVRSLGRRTDRIDADPCGAISGFLDDLPAAAANAVGSLAPAEGGFWSRVASVGAVVAGAAAYATATAARTLIRNLPFVDALRKAASAVSAAADLKAMFTQWNVKIEPQPGSVHKSVVSPNQGALVLTVTPPEPGFEWPQQVRSCAELLDVPLPQFDSADGATVVWTTLAGFPSPATQKSAQQQLSGGKAELIYTTVEESEAVHLAAGPEQSTPASVKADIGLPGLERLGSTLAGMMNAPGLAAATSAGSSLGASLLGPSATGQASVTFHASPATLDIEIVDDATFRLHAVSCSGVEGPYQGTASVIGDPGGTAPLTPFSFDPATKTAQLAVDIPMAGTCSGTYAVHGPMTLGGSDGAPMVQVNANVSGSLSCPFGPVPLSAPATGTFPLKLGPAAECP